MAAQGRRSPRRTTRRYPDGQGPRTQREERQAVRGPAQEGDEQVTGGGDRQLRRLLQPRRQEQRLESEPQELRQRQRRQQGAEGRGRTEGRKEVELGRISAAALAGRHGAA